MAGLVYTTGTQLTGKGRSAFENGRILALGDQGVYTGLAVSERAAGGANMSVDVAAGTYYAVATMVTKTAITNVVIGNGHADYDRYDLIYAKSDGTVTVAAGTAAAVPQVPAVPANSIPLAVVLVEEDETTSVVDADITDARLLLRQADLKYLHHNNTQANVAPAGAAYEDVQTQAISTSDSCYAKLIVRAEGYVDHHALASSSTRMRLCNNITAVGSDTHSVGAVSATSNEIPHNVERVYVAGTDYVRGTAFTLRFRANKQSTQAVTIYCNSLVVIGVT